MAASIQPDPSSPSAGHLPKRLTASRIRTADFPTTRRGCAPQAVREFLGLVADEVLRLHQRLAAAHAETDRIKRHLRQWQTDHATTCRGPRPRDLPNQPARGQWPTNQAATVPPEHRANRNQ